jgi:hypothetical protein
MRYALETPLSHSLIHEGAMKCIISASEIVEIITTFKNQTPKAIPPWWENLGYAFACANVFVAARLCPLGVHEELEDDKLIQVGWQRSILLLEEYCPYATLASKCIAALEHITDALLPDEAEQQVAGYAGPPPAGLRDMAWLECLPVDLE